MRPELKAIGDQLIASVRGLVARAVAPRDARLDALERRLAELEGRQLRYLGPFEHGRAYRRGEMVTDKGSLWHCDADTTTRPGDSDAWTLAAKRGADGRDARGGAR